MQLASVCFEEESVGSGLVAGYRLWQAAPGQAHLLSGQILQLNMTLSTFMRLRDVLHC